MYVWLIALSLTAACAALAASQIDFVVPVVAVLAVLLLIATLIAWCFRHPPETAGGKQFETFSGVCTLLIYLSVGIGPLYWHWSSTKLGGSP